MSDALPLPPHPHLGYYRKLAKDLVKACADPVGAAQLGDEICARSDRAVESHIRSAKIAKLADAQFLIARAHGFASWPKFARHIDALQHAGSADSKFELAADAIVSGDIDALRRLLDEHRS